ncbi:META domain-containing protein [Aquimarina sp. BL5]|uniref:META domain-containing protein n=1 Tax=Aquimarina sp. BL5 TaxID=1714860 RepID=UPI000E4CC339|nr:META domain-containing protein [Aquimarina sp. BL5]AXT52658.1 META domain-containing protein [Aquimarina sp. BL5]RKN11722.1 META domain-containing protein [Aquimarina sp. BL5]
MKYLGLLLISLTLFCNCNSTNTATSKNTETKNQSEPEGKYLVTSLYGKDVSEHKLTLEFDKANKKLSGFSGCNIYYCDYTVTDSSLSIGAPGASKRYCEQTMKLEKEFFKALSELKTKNLKEPTLTFKNENQNEILVAKKSE